MGSLSLTFNTIEVLSSRALTILLFVFGVAIAIIVFPRLSVDGITGKDATSELLVIFMPYLVVKALTLLLAAAFDGMAASSREFSRQYSLNFEKAKARIFRILYEKQLRSYSPVDTALGIERYLLPVVQPLLAAFSPWKGVPTVLVTRNPFVAVRIRYRKLDEKAALQTGQPHLVDVQVAAEEPQARILAKIILSSLEALSKEEQANA